MAEKTRVHTLAKEMNVSSKAILEKCRAEGLDVKNHMSTLTAGLEATIREWFSEGAHSTVVETAERIDLKKVRKKAKPRKPAEAPESEIAVETDEAETTTADVADAETALDDESATPILVEPEDAETVEEPEVSEVVQAPEEVTIAVEAPTASADEVVAAETTAVPTAEAPVEVSTTPEDVEASEEAEPAEPAEPIRPAGPQNVPAPAKLSGPRVVRYEPADHDEATRRPPRRRPEPARAAGEITPEAGEAGDRDGGRGGKRRGGPVDATKAGRRRSTTKRSSRSANDAGEKLAEWNSQDLAERRERLRGATGRRASSRRAASKRPQGGGQSTPARTITEAQIEEPIVVKDFCAAIGVPFQRVLPVLTREHSLLLTINGILPKEVAELVGLEFGVELRVVEAKTGMDHLKEEYQAIERKNMQTRPPIVTVLGHVDHGKTSLLDYIRRSRVADREDGGITQHISSYHLERDNVSVTFLDTPGHEAFTALRARGAQITDVVVLVVAADDGVMPQTIEAINHAKAAGVPIVVALNKIDLGTQNVTKIYGQLTEHGLTPSGDWGGEIDVIHTSATTGQGVDALLEHLSALAELNEYKADPSVPATGTVVEAESRQGVGAVMQVIIRDGTVHIGDILVCGNAFGKVRAIHDDNGKAVNELGPSMPAEIWGMNEVPASGDHFYQVDNLQRAKQIADEVRQRRLTDARSTIKKARSLDDLMKQRTDADVRELNVIVKADVDGSVDVLANALGQFPSDEVKLNILHAGIGAVTDSDVHLADASDAIVVTFRVTAPATTRRLAEQLGVDIRHYKVIYELTDDIKKALEGLLAPDEVIEQRGSAEVREVFRISRVGLVAGCYVRDGSIAASDFARVIRDGVVVRDKSRFHSLRRFKDDVKEVRNGMECGIRLEGFDDIKVGDTIESFAVIEVARTLD